MSHWVDNAKYKHPEVFKSFKRCYTNTLNTFVNYTLITYLWSSAQNIFKHDQITLFRHYQSLILCQFSDLL